jgi:hypothetical protein
MAVAGRAGWAVALWSVTLSPAQAECLGACAERLGYFLISGTLLPVLAIALALALWFRKRLLATILGVGLAMDAIVLIATA